VEEASGRRLYLGKRFGVVSVVELGSASVITPQEESLLVEFPDTLKTKVENHRE
jgi:hypothetical protein